MENLYIMYVVCESHIPYILGNNLILRYLTKKLYFIQNNVLVCFVYIRTANKDPPTPPLLTVQT